MLDLGSRRDIRAPDQNPTVPSLAHSPSLTRSPHLLFQPLQTLLLVLANLSQLLQGHVHPADLGLQAVPLARKPRP